MSWLIRLSQSVNITDIIEGVCNNTMDINIASNQISFVGPSACDEINARALADVKNQAKMRKLSIAAGCQDFLQQGAQNQDSLFNPGLMSGEQEAPVDMPVAEIG